jgi:hypothetical protein
MVNTVAAAAAAAAAADTVAVWAINCYVFFARIAATLGVMWVEC